MALALTRGGSSAMGGGGAFPAPGHPQSPQVPQWWPGVEFKSRARISWRTVASALDILSQVTGQPWVMADRWGFICVGCGWEACIDIAPRRGTGRWPNAYMRAVDETLDMTVIHGAGEWVKVRFWSYGAAPRWSRWQQRTAVLCVAASLGATATACVQRSLA